MTYARLLLITKVEITNIKNHAAAAYEFNPGVTAICGPNGAGKTTIIEAIAWALFDHLDYNREDFVRRGSKRGQVAITFRSNLDDREYVVSRDTSGGYSVFDPDTKMRLLEQKKDVVVWLRQHIGVEPNTDLSTLFKSTVGVPQGTFTADFLQSPALRKKVFDQILQVEEYRAASDKLRATQKFLDTRIGEIDRKLAEAEGELKIYDEIHAHFLTISTQLESLQKEQEKLARARAEAEQKMLRLSDLAEQIKQQRGIVERVQIKLDLTRGNLSSAREAAEQARQAADIVTQSSAGFANYQAATQQLTELEKQRATRESLRANAAQIERELAKTKAQTDNANERLQEVAHAQKEFAQFSARVAEQENLEKQIAQLRESRGQAQGLQHAKDALERELKKLRERYAEISAQIKESDQHKKLAESTDALESTVQKTNEQLAKLRAEIARDNEMIVALAQGGICPLLTEKCLNLKAGETLDSRFQKGVEERRKEIIKLEKSLQTTNENLRQAREAGRLYSQADVLRREQKALEQEGKHKKIESEELEKKFAAIGDFENKFQTAESALKALGDPRSRAAGLEQTIKREKEWQSAKAKAETQAQQISAQLEKINTELLTFAELDVALTTANVARATNEQAYQAYIGNEKIAGTLAAREKEAASLSSELLQTETNLNAATAQLVALEEKYDLAEHQQAAMQFNQLRERTTQIATQLEHAQAQHGKLQAQVNYLNEVRERRRTDLAAREKLTTTQTTTDFIRDTLQKAAPYITDAYLHSISIEANQLFREISGRYDATLKWSNDYEISLEERGYARPFANLSGGEQMAAALSVRLALLKEFSDNLSLAFFDEPTTNMDEDRRKNLAQQIGRITGFKQLFVISHDDSFENFTDQVVYVGERT